MSLKSHLEDDIRVQVTKKLTRDDIQSIVRDFVKQRLTFAVSKHDSDYEVWRQVLPGDQPRVKNRKDGMTPDGVISQDPDELNQRNFVCVWEEGKLVEGSEDLIK
ncbi:MAG: hypothetical protein GC154_13670 [bacterium]|nr:hypothetical protein [bacterium]